MPQVITSPEQAPLRVGIYGEPKTGKSWLSLALPNRGRWAGRTIFVAAEPESEIHALADPRNIVVKPIVAPKYDPYTEFTAIASKDWKAEYPDAANMVWDTMTWTAREYLSQIADSGNFSEKHISIGKAGTASYLALPMEGDFGGAQGMMLQTLRHLFRQPLNVLVLFHGDLFEPKSADSGIIRGGPASIGKAAITSIAGMFSNLFRTECRERTVPGTPPKRVTEYVVHTAKKGVWMAGIRLKPGVVNPIPEIIVPADNPTIVWDKFDEVAPLLKEPAHAV